MVCACKPLVLEAARAVWRAVAGRAVPASGRGAEIAATARGLAARHVVQAAQVAVRVGAVGDAARVASEGIDAGDDRRGDARAAEDQPTALALVGVAIVDRDAGV